MTAKTLAPLVATPSWICRSCQRQSRETIRDSLRRPTVPSRRLFTSSPRVNADVQIRAAPEIGLEERDKKRRDPLKEPARIVPLSASYFTTSPVFSDHLLKLQQFLKNNGSLPVVRADDAPQMSWMSLEQVRSFTGEKVGAAKYAQALRMLRRLNLIHPKYSPSQIRQYLELFRRPGHVPAPPAKPTFIDEYGVSKGLGRRKSAVARVSLVEGTGEVLINGQSIISAFPRIHDRESALWPLKVTERIDKYNAFVSTHGGGLTGQAESVTLAMAKALIVHEPALKPALRKAGCITRNMKRVERKKPGRAKARKMPTWVKR